MANRETERDRPDGPDHAGSGHAGPGGNHAHAKDKFGGFNWGGAFFGWLVATGVAVLLLALAGAIGGPIAGSSGCSTQQAVGAAGTIGIVGRSSS